MTHMPTLAQPAVGAGVSATRAVNTTGGLTGGGTLAADLSVSIADGGVTLAKMANVATATFVGRTSSGAGVPEALTAAQATALLGAFTSGAQGVVPASGGGTANFLRADGTWQAAGGTSQLLSVKANGAAGDGVTIDDTAIAAAIATAKTTGAHLYFPAGTYRISKYLDFANTKDLQIIGDRAIISYPSDSLVVVADAVAITDAQARSAILLRNCQGSIIEGITFQGGPGNEVSQNIGVGIFQTRCQGTRISNCTALDGAGLHAQDTQTNTLGSGASIAVAAGIVTITGSGFLAGHFARTITITNATNKANNGVFPIASWISATQITITNPDAATETSSFLWQIDDADRNTQIMGCTIRRPRGTLSVPSQSKVLGTTFSQPMTPDLAGIVGSFAQVTTVTTLSAKKGSWDTTCVGRYVIVKNSTSAANNGRFLITAATKRTRFIPATLTYTNAAGVAEVGSTTGTWWIPGGERVGIGSGATSIAYSAGVVTFTASAATFAATDVRRVIRIGEAVNNPINGISGNVGAFIIASVVSSTVVTFANANGANETYSGIFSVDDYDAAGPSGGAVGSTHFIYVFAGSDVVEGRQDIEIAGCTFIGCRKNAVKVSGSSSLIRSIRVHNNTAIECGAFATAGADDSQEHTGITFDYNTIIDCGTGRQGWSEAVGITFLGCDSSGGTGNHFHYTRPNISKVDVRDSLAGAYAVQAFRYITGVSQPLTNFVMDATRLTIDYENNRPGLSVSAGVHVESCGLVAYYRTGGTLTITSTTMTLADSSANFTQALVGASIEIYGAPDAANNVKATVLSVSGTGALTFTNAAGVGGGVAAGTYRIQPAYRGSTCRISRTMCDGAASNAVESYYNVSPEIVDTQWNNCTAGILENGSVAPYLDRWQQVGRVNSNAGIQLGSNTAWPVVGHGKISGNGPIHASDIRGDVGIGIDSFVKIDHPLLGLRGRCRPTDGKCEIVIAYGSGLVNGDTLYINGSACTYDDTIASASVGRKFKTMAGLITILTGSGVTAEEYGSTLAGTPTTGHIRVHLTTAALVTNALYIDGNGAVINVLNPTALVIPRGDTGPFTFSYGRGEQAAGPLAKRFIVWSPMCSYSGTVSLAAANATAAATLAGGWFHEKNANNAGNCEVLSGVNVTNAADEYRWTVG